jgi:hypothetical protein
VNGRLPASLNSPLALAAFPTCSRSLALSFSFRVSHGRREERQERALPHQEREESAPLSPPSEDFGDSYYSEEVSSEYDRSPVLASPMASSDDSDNSMGLSITERAYARSIERAGLGGSDDSEGASSEEVEDSSNSKEGSSSEGGSDGDEGDGSSSGGSDGSGDDDIEGSDDDDGGEGSSRGGGSDGNAGGIVLSA